ncbi:hypothetical protein N7486_010928, partial [Penicillium sp. IBT 16267x]
SAKIAWFVSNALRSAAVGSEYFVLRLHSFVGRPTRNDKLRAAASDVYSKATSLFLSLIALNPFRDEDGLKSAQEVDARLEEAELWCQLCQIMRVPIFQNYVRPGCDSCQYAKTWSSSPKVHLRVGYEAPAWGIPKNTWQHIQEVIDLVNLPNVGHCLDTFHIASREAGDPFNTASPIRKDGYNRLQKSLEELKGTVDPRNIVCLHLSDAIVADPEQKGYPVKELKQPPFMTQSRNCRIFPCEAHLGGTLPAIEVAKAIFDVGYNGWVSMEVFHTEMFDTRASVPDDWARRGMESWRHVVARCGLNHRAKF